MIQKRIFLILSLILLSSAASTLIYRLEQRVEIHQSSQLDTLDEAIETLRALELPKEDYSEVCSCATAEYPAGECLLAYLFCRTTQPDLLYRWCDDERDAQRERFETFRNALDQLFADAVYFPIPETKKGARTTVSYENSWNYARTYGGERRHEGTDIMADVQQRGYYPIISVSDGTVEKMGWLPQGGYRIGIRSEHGVYYYYAHLAEYEDGLAVGDAVKAGELIGYMGDTGYSEVEGTTGNFPVHLHFGMYLDDADGNEMSFNPYYLLRILEDNKLEYIY